MRLITAGACLALMLVAGSTVLAREPGVGPSIPPGVTSGQPNAVPVPPGFVLAAFTSYYDAIAVGPGSQYLGLRYLFANETVLGTWAPDLKVLGAAYKSFVLIPIIGARLLSEPPAPRGSAQQGGIANPLLQLADLSWTLGNGFYINAGFGLFFPIGQYSFNAPINLGAPFWTFEPSAAFTYFKDGWTASAQIFYDINTTNPVNNYYSGNEFAANFTFTKLFFDRVNFGPVGYWYKQVTGDANWGGPSVYGGLNAPNGDDLAIGASLSTQFGKLAVQLMFTQDVYVVNGIGGAKGWLNLIYQF